MKSKETLQNFTCWMSRKSSSGPVASNDQLWKYSRFAIQHGGK
jgi:hypothetical protein